MKHYLKIYKALMRLNFFTLISFRANFINDTFSSFVWGILHIITILLLTHNTETAFGWSKAEIIILVSSFNIFIGFFHMLFSYNLEKIYEEIHYGRLDSILLKPVDSQFLLSTWIIKFTSIFRIFITIVFIYYIAGQYNIHLDLTKLFIFIPLMISGMIFLYSFWFVVMTLLIWNPQLSNLEDLMFTANGFIRFPKEMFQKLNSFLFLLFLPLALIVATPTKVLLNKFSWIDSLQLIFLATFTFLISRLFWKFALRSYTSASS